jgi:hypothetical protein
MNSTFELITCKKSRPIPYLGIETLIILRLPWSVAQTPLGKLYGDHLLALAPPLPMSQRYNLRETGSWVQLSIVSARR